MLPGAVEQESSARLERTARRDLETDLDLVQKLLRKPAVDVVTNESDGQFEHKKAHRPSGESASSR